MFWRLFPCSFQIKVLTTLSRVLDKLIVTLLVKKFPYFLCITVFTRARFRSLSWASCIQFTSFPSCLPKIHSDIIFPSTPRSSEWFLPVLFWPKFCMHLSQIKMRGMLLSKVTVLFNLPAVACTVGLQLVGINEVRGREEGWRTSLARSVILFKILLYGLSFVQMH
jgi:hypothetical protein